MSTVAALPKASSDMRVVVELSGHEFDGLMAYATRQGLTIQGLLVDSAHWCRRNRISFVPAEVVAEMARLDQEAA